MADETRWTPAEVYRLVELILKYGLFVTALILGYVKADDLVTEATEARKAMQAMQKDVGESRRVFMGQPEPKE